MGTQFRNRIFDVGEHHIRAGMNSPLFDVVFIIAKDVAETDVRLARADLLAGSQSAAEYEFLLKGHNKVPEAEEGLGLLALSPS